MKLRHIGIVCSDVRKMIDFYCSFLGAPEKIVAATESGGFITAVLRGKPPPCSKPARVTNEVIVQTTKLTYKDGFTLEFLHYIQPTPIPKNGGCTPIRFGISHLSFSVPNLETVHNGLRALAGEHIFVSSTQVNEEKTAKVCFIVDPEGKHVELVEELS